MKSRYVVALFFAIGCGDTTAAAIATDAGSEDAQTGIDAAAMDAADASESLDASETLDAPTDALSSACLSASPVCVGDAGATADGGVDDTSCLQALLDSGKPIVLPPGKSFTITKALQLPDNVSLEGCGSSITLSSHPDVVLKIVGNGVSVDDVRIHYDVDTVNAGIVDFAAGVNHFSITNSIITGVDVAGVQINNPDISDITIRGNTISGMHYGILFNTTNWPAADLPVLAHHPHDVIIDGNTITGVTADAVEVNSAVYDYIPHNSGTPGVAAHDITITNNHLEAPTNSAEAGFCLGIAGAFDIRVSGNVLTQCKYAFMHLEDTANNVVIENNVMTNVIGALSGETDYWGSDTAGIILLNSNHISILGNQLKGSPQKLIDQTYDAQGDYDHDVTISGNAFANANQCIFIGGSSSENLATFIGASTTDAGAFPINTATGCTTPLYLVPNAMGVTVDNAGF